MLRTRATCDVAVPGFTQESVTSPDFWSGETRRFDMETVFSMVSVPYQNSGSLKWKW